MPHSTDSPNNVPRRSFFANFTAALFGLVALAAPTIAGIAVLFDPLRKKRGGGEDDGEAGNWIRVASLSQVPPDGKPHLFPVIEDAPRDKWNLYEPQAVGSVFLTRSSADELPTAISSVCPHLGCAVDFHAAADQFVCPCHNGYFHVDGTQTAESKVSPRDLDPLQVRLDSQSGKIEVNYKSFKSGIAERVEV